MDLDFDDFRRRWPERWPGSVPGDDLRDGTRTDTYFRMHSLPQSKEYAETAVEYAQVLHRHHVLLADLLTQSGLSDDTPLIVMTRSWSSGPEVKHREPWVHQMVPADHFSTVLNDPHPEFPQWAHTFVGLHHVMDDALASLILLMAGDKAAGITITTESLDWLYRPYHGGVDIIGLSEAKAADFQEEHSDWLPVDQPLEHRGRHPDGDVPGWSLVLNDLNETSARRLLAIAEAENLLISNGWVVNPRRELTLQVDREDAQLLRILLTGESERVLDGDTGLVHFVDPEQARKRLSDEFSPLEYQLDEFVEEYGYRDPREAVDGILPGKYWDPEQSYDGIIGRGPVRKRAPGDALPDASGAAAD